jgi:glyoxylase-like metal-dependent hydrolase (beta-lactamase superfamily II)
VSAADAADDRPYLAKLVSAGSQQTEAEKIADDIYMFHSTSNAYLVTSQDGDVLVNAGSGDPPSRAGRTKAMMDPVRRGPLRYIILTQSHGDHYGGVEQLREPDTKIVTERRFPETLAWYALLDPFTKPRTNRLWRRAIPREPGQELRFDVEPDLLVDRRLELEVGGRRFELISTPGGETIDSLTVWLPEERIAFTGNLFGPVFMSMPFLNTIRGDKPRSVLRYLHSLDLVRSLEPELLVTGHGQPIRGRDKVRADLDKLHAAVSYVNDATVAGMNAGKDVDTLVREITLPEELKIGEYHGNVKWAVRSIWHEYAGWFHYESTTELYGVPRSSVDADLVELAGGVGALAKRAREKAAAGRPLEAIHLLDIALRVDPGHRESLSVKREAVQQLLDAGGNINLSETMWLRAERAAAEAGLAEAAGD